MDQDELEGASYSAMSLRDTGNEHFKAQRFAEAADCYRLALSEKPGDLAQTIRLNLATCVLRLGIGLNEAITLCDEFLVSDATSAKAFYLRGSAGHALANQVAAPEARRELWQAAKKDLTQAAKISPADRQIRARLDEVTEALRALPPKPGIFAKGGLYDDRQPAPKPPPPVVCSECGREGHPRCGKNCWLDLRAAWLGVDRDAVDVEPESFEDDGPLGVARRQALLVARGASEDNSAGAPFSDMSDDEREMLEDCLDSTERPYPKLKRRVALPQVVFCAEELWDDT